MKICLVNLDFIPYRSSGLAIYGETLALGLDKAGHEVTVIASQRKNMSVYDQIEGIRVYRVPIGRLDWISYAWRAGSVVARLHQSQHFDAVHFLDVHFAYHYRGVYIASLFQSFRQRATSDGGLPYHSNWYSLMVRLIYYNTARWLAEKPALNRAEYLLAASQATAKEFIVHYGLLAERVRVVPLGIDFSRLRPIDAKGLRLSLGLGNVPILLYVGFCTPRKGLEYLAQAMQLLSDDVRLVLVGRWEKDYRAKFYRALGAARDHIIEAGYVPDEELPAYYTMADIFVFPTLLEGFGLPLAEALACGTPAITTNAGSSPEIIGPGGRIVPPRDPVALATAINELLADFRLRRNLGQAGREWVLSHFDQNRMIQESLAAYDRFFADSR